MSWITGYKKASTSKASEESALREEKRKKLEQERLSRNQKRTAHREQLQRAIESRREAEKALQGLLEIDPDIFNSSDSDKIEISPEEESELLSIPTMANFDELNADNGADAMKNLGQIRVNWDADDPQYFFQKLETELQIFEINKQFTKRQALIRLIPDAVGKEFKHLINLQETEAGTLAYKVLKTALIKAYGPRPGDSYQRAVNRVMTGKPSVLLKLIISDICNKNMSDCCCSSTIWGIFEQKIPLYLKSGLANEVFNATNMQNIMDKADNYWAANQVENQVSAVSTPGTAAQVSSPVTAANNSEVSAIGRGRGNSFRGRYNRGGRRGGRGTRGNQSGGQDPRGKRHESNPPWNSCGAHWVYAEDAFKCQSPTTCPLKDKVKPKA